MTRIPVIHAVDSQGGGKGKSLFTRLLAHYTALNRYAVQIVDADVNKKNIRPFYLDTIEIAISAEEYWGTDVILASLEQGMSVVINLPAGADSAFKRWLDDDGVLGLFLNQGSNPGQRFEAELDSGEHPIRLVRWFLCDATPESLTDFKASIESYQTQPYADRVTHVLVRNYGLSPEFAWNRLQDEDLEQLLDQPNLHELILPEFKMLERDRVQGLQLEFAQTIKKPEGDEPKHFNVTERQRIVTFLKKVTTVLDQTGLWKDAPKWEEDVPRVELQQKAKGSKNNGNGGKKVLPDPAQPTPVAAN